MEEPVMRGGAAKHQFGQDDADLANSLSGEINQKIGVINASYTIVNAKKQIVNGTNYSYHLKGNPHNTEVTVRIHVSLAGHPNLSEATLGHNHI